MGAGDLGRSAQRAIVAVIALLVVAAAALVVVRARDPRTGATGSGERSGAGASPTTSLDATSTNGASLTTGGTIADAIQGSPGTSGVKVTAPAPGTYRYRERTVITGVSEGPEDDGGRERELVIRDAGEGRRAIHESKDGDAQIHLYRDGGVFFAELQGQGGCDWHPDVLLLGRLEIGASWRSSGSCTSVRDGRSLTLSAEVSGKVLRREKLRVGGDQVDAFVVERSVRTSFEGADGTPRVATATEVLHFDPERGLDLKSDYAATSPDRNVTTRRIRELLSLKGA